MTPLPKIAPKTKKLAKPNEEASAWHEAKRRSLNNIHGGKTNHFLLFDFDTFMTGIWENALINNSQIFTFPIKWKGIFLGVAHPRMRRTTAPRPACSRALTLERAPLVDRSSDLLQTYSWFYTFPRNDPTPRRAHRYSTIVRYAKKIANSGFPY